MAEERIVEATAQSLRSQLCFCDFQMLLFNKLDLKLTDNCCEPVFYSTAFEKALDKTGALLFFLFFFIEACCHFLHRFSPYVILCG